jgi:ATP-dependent Clp protease ATP-binding subunit ClpC
MSEYMEKHNVSRLVGAPPGYVGYEEGGQLTERVAAGPTRSSCSMRSRRPTRRVQHAAPDHGGRPPDRLVRAHVDFKNTIIIMTSNVGATKITHESPFGFQKQDDNVSYEKMKETLQGELENHFRPEFINRLDELELELTQDAKDFLIERGSDEKFGARPLRRAIEQYVEDALSEDMLRNKYAGKNRVIVTVKQPPTDDDLPMLVFEGVHVESSDEAVGAGAGPDVADAT